MSAQLLDKGYEHVCAVSDLATGSAALAEVGGLPVALVRTTDGSIHAVQDTCTHGKVSLSEGEVSGTTLECWLHGSRFDLVTGKPLCPPATQSLDVYEVAVADGAVYIRVSAPVA